jgi:ABC-type multidrug transport system permease subunit
MGEPHTFADRPLVQLTLVRFREFWREPEAVFWTFVFPILMAAGLGVAFRDRPPDVIKIGIVGSAGAATLRPQAESGGGVSAEIFPDEASAQRALRTGRVALLVIPGQSGQVAYRYDDTNPDGRSARMLVDRALQLAAGGTSPLAVKDQRVREPGGRYIDFLIPGLLGMNLMGSGIWGIGFAIVDARRKKLLKRLVASPMSRAQYLASFLFSRLLFLIVEVITLLSFGALVFGVPFNGSMANLAAICLLSALSFSALGLLIASRVRTIEAASGIMNFVMLPMWIVSGVFFSARRFPDLIQPVIRALPLTAAIDSLRANMLEGAGLDQVGGKLVILAMWLFVSFTVALKIFRWR